MATSFSSDFESLDVASSGTATAATAASTASAATLSPSPVYNPRNEISFIGSYAKNGTPQ